MLKDKKVSGFEFRVSSSATIKLETLNSELETDFGVWCNASIRVLETRGDSSTLSSPTKVIADFQLLIVDWFLMANQIGNRKSTIGNALAPVAQIERARRFERRGCGFKSCQEFHLECGGNDAALDRFLNVSLVVVLTPKSEAPSLPAHSKTRK